MAHPKILVVEDDPIILMMSADVLRDAGLTVLEAPTADAAAEILETLGSAVAVVFSDIETPGRLNGIDVALKAKAVRACLPVVLTSGRVVPAVGALPPDIHFIGKPYNLKALAALIVRLADADPDGPPRPIPAD